MNKYEAELDLNSENSLALVARQLRENAAILEFGPAAGRLTQYLKEVLHCQVDIIEIDPEGYGKAIEYARDGYLGDIEEYLWEDAFAGREYDFILCADVLEHLRDPQKTVIEAKKFLKDEGVLIASIPNVGHNSIIYNLLRNKFQYNPLGLLDNTHIHLFTYDSIQEMFSNAGYIFLKEDATYRKEADGEVPYSLEEAGMLEKSTLWKHAYGDVYQFVVTVRKRLPGEEDNLDETLHLAEKKYVWIYYRDDADYSEEKKICVPLSHDNVMDLMFTKEGNLGAGIALPENVREIRIDPVRDIPIVLKGFRMTNLDQKDKELKFLFNDATYTDQETIYFNQIPQIYVDVLNTKKFHISAKVEIMLDGAVYPRIRGLCKTIETERKKHIEEISQKENIITEREKIIAERENIIIQRDRLIALRDLEIKEKKQAIEELQQHLLMMDQEMTVLGAHRDALQESFDIMEKNYHLIASSKFWRMTKPLRAMASGIKKILRPILHIEKGIANIYQAVRREGMAVVRYKIREKSARKKNGSLSDYERWIQNNEKELYTVEALNYQPLISVVVPVYNVEKALLEKCIESVLEQTYKNFELCLADDDSTMPCVKDVLENYKQHPQIKIAYRKENGHISACTNSAIELATGEFVAFMDCDDVIAPNALYEVVKKLNEDEYDFIYSDEDKIAEDGKHRFSPHFKPDWSPDTLMSMMYTSHLGVYRKSIGDEIGWLRQGFEGAQDYDFTLRFTEKTDRIGHVSKVLYHWRVREESTASNPKAKDYVKNATYMAKKQALKRRNLKGFLEWVDEVYQYRVVYEMPEQPLVSVIIPSKDNFEVYSRCIDTILRYTSYTNYEIITVDNGSSKECRSRYRKFAQEKNIMYIYEPMEFNFSRMCNIGVRKSKGEYVLLLNDDMEIISKEWMSRMVGHASLSYVGAVGAKLLYPNTKLIQHVGVVSFDSGPSHTLCQYDDSHPLAFNKNRIEYNYSAVTAACLMVARRKYDEVGGFNEDFAVAYNDVNFCWDLCERGYYNVARMDAVLYHHESLSRGSDVMDPSKFRRLRDERLKLYKAHPRFAMGDPFYNENLTMRKGDCSVNPDVSFYGRKVCGKKVTQLQISEESVSCEATYSLENIAVKDGILHVDGWFILNDSARNNQYRTYVYLVGEGRTYLFETVQLYRPDINQLTGQSGKNSLSAFVLSGDVSMLEPGEYKIYLKKKKVVVDTQHSVEVKE